MGKITRFEDLIAWQKGRSLVRDIYVVSNQRPFVRDFAMRDQVRDAALSIPSNIAEGFERGRHREFLQFLNYARASCGEVRSQLYAAFDVGHIDELSLSQLLSKAEEVARIIRGLQKAIERRHLPSRHSALGTRNFKHVPREP